MTTDFSAAATVKAVELRLLDDLFEMGQGYVLDFSDRTFGDFFRGEIGVNIDEPVWASRGGSKAKRLRCFFQTADRAQVLKALLALWDYREANRKRRGDPETVPDGEKQFYDLVERLGGRRPKPASPAARPAPVGPDAAECDRLAAELVRLSGLPPQERGFAFERFLKALLDANGLNARGAFRTRGEQIDGSFELEGETYLLEAKWTAAPSDAADLREFHGKLDEKAAWSRGLFMTQSGLTPDALAAFGRGKKLICMDALDLNDLLQRRLPLAVVLKAKVRRAAETGELFVRVRDLFPA